MDTPTDPITGLVFALERLGPPRKPGRRASDPTRRVTMRLRLGRPGDVALRNRIGFRLQADVAR
jgi:hypothetical protein